MQRVVINNKIDHEKRERRKKAVLDFEKNYNKSQKYPWWSFYKKYLPNYIKKYHIITSNTQMILS